MIHGNALASMQYGSPKAVVREKVFVRKIPQKAFFTSSKELLRFKTVDEPKPL